MAEEQEQRDDGGGASSPKPTGLLRLGSRNVRSTPRGKFPLVIKNAIFPIHSPPGFRLSSPAV